MQPRTKAALEKLKGVEWFRSVGVHDPDLENDMEVLNSWPEAIAGSKSVEWEKLGLLAVNEFRMRLVERASKEFSRWNDIVDMVKPAAAALVAEKTSRVVREHHLPKVFVDMVNWDIVHLLIESEYADVLPPAYYASQAFWYWKGRFPCGWRGQFPQGKLIIY